MNNYFSVIIPFRGKKEILERVLLALQNTNYPYKEVILVNDGMDENLDSIVLRSQCKLINLPYRCGPSFARNTGAKAANFRYLVFLDSDIVVPKDCFLKISDFLEANRSVSVANSVMSSCNPYNNFFSQYLNMYFRYTVFKKSSITLFSFFCIIEDRCFFEVGGFDENVLLQYADDLVLGWKLQNKGFKFALIEGVEPIHYKEINLFKFVNWVFLHAYFYSLNYIMYKPKLDSLNSCLNKSGIAFLSMVILILNLMYLKLLSLAVSIFGILLLGLIINCNFLFFLVKEKGCLQAFKNVWVLIPQYFISSAGFVVGVMTSWLRNLLAFARKPRDSIAGMSAKGEVSSKNLNFFCGNSKASEVSPPRE